MKKLLLFLLIFLVSNLFSLTVNTYDVYDVVYNEDKTKKIALFETSPNSGKFFFLGLLNSNEPLYGSVLLHDTLIHSHYSYGEAFKFPLNKFLLSPNGTLYAYVVKNNSDRTVDYYLLGRTDVDCKPYFNLKITNSGDVICSNDCVKGYTLDNGKCVKKCKSPFIYDKKSNTCKLNCNENEYYDVFTKKCTKNCEELGERVQKGECLCQKNKWGDFIDFKDMRGGIDTSNNCEGSNCDLGGVSTFGYISKSDNEFYESTDYDCVLDCSTKSKGFSKNSPMCNFKYISPITNQNSNPANPSVPPTPNNPNNGGDGGSGGKPDTNNTSPNNGGDGGSGGNNQTIDTNNTSPNNGGKPDTNNTSPNNGGSGGNGGKLDTNKTDPKKGNPGGKLDTNKTDPSDGGNDKDDDFGKFDGKFDDLGKVYEEGHQSFLDFFNSSKKDVDNIIKDAKDKLSYIKEHGFFKFKKDKINSCPFTSKTIDFGFFHTNLSFDICDKFSQLYSVFYFLTFISTLFLGIKFIFSRALSSFSGD